MGADDYLPKLFNPRQLVARIRAIQRRAEPAQEREAEGRREPIVIGDVDSILGPLDGLDGRPVDVTAARVRALGGSPARVGLAPEAARRSGPAGPGRPLSPHHRSIDVHISKLRAEAWTTNSATPSRIKTVRGAAAPDTRLRDMQTEHSLREKGSTDAQPVCQGLPPGLWGGDDARGVALPHRARHAPRAAGRGPMARGTENRAPRVEDAARPAGLAMAGGGPRGDTPGCRKRRRHRGAALLGRAAGRRGADGQAPARGVLAAT